MKTMKRLGTTLALIGMLVFGSVFVANAAEGTLQFSDPTTKVGEEVTVKVKIATGGAAIGDGDATVTYDTSYLEFKNGENATGGDGKVTLSTTGDGTQSELAYTMVFKALKEGSTTLSVEDYTSYLYSDETLNLTTGTATVTIEAGDGTSSDEGSVSSSGESLSVSVNGKDYTLNEDFSEAVIPAGFTEGTVQIDGKDRRVMLMDGSDYCLVYLKDSDGNSDYFLYNTKESAYEPTELVDISDSCTIFLMNHKGSDGLPSKYQETTSDINGKEFTAWQNTSSTDYFLVYALCTDGSEGYYQYDTAQGTYQRYTVPTKTEKASANGWLDKIQDLVNGHFMIVLIVVWAVILVLLLLVIIKSIQVHRRNNELDELYSDVEGGYGSGSYDDEDSYGSDRSQKGYDDEYSDDFGDDDYDDEYDDDFEDGDYDDEYGDDFEDDEYDDEYEDDFEDGDYDDEYEDDFEDDEYEDEYEDGYGDDLEDDDYDDEYDDFEDGEYDDEYDDEFEDDDNPYSDALDLEGATRQIELPKRNAKKEEDDFSLDFINLDD